MNDLQSTHRTGEDATLAAPLKVEFLDKLADELRSQWASGNHIQLAAYLKKHSELCADRSLIIDLAVDEYRLLRTLGQASSIKQFCKPFTNLDGALQSSIFRQIEVQKYYDENPCENQLAEQTNWPQVGDLLASYQVLEEMGRGSLARAYLASQNTLGDRKVVVKVSRRGTQEGQTLGKLQHPHIIPVHSIEVAEDNELYYMCMPFLGKNTLQDLVGSAFSSGSIPTSAKVIAETGKARLLPDDVVSTITPAKNFRSNCSYINGVLQLGVKLADALGYAHHAGIIHSDLKPSNVLLTPEGEPVLLDFNLARDVSLDVRGGTLLYMAPEQITKLLLGNYQDHIQCDEKSEIYSLGVVLYELLCGKLPFDVDFDVDDTTPVPKQLLNKQQAGPASLGKRNPQIASQLEKKIRRCLTYDQEQRYKSMSELRAALLQEMMPHRRFVNWAYTHRRLSSAIALAVSCLLFAVGYWLMNRQPYATREYQRGVALQREDRFSEARVAFENAVLSRPDFLEARFAAACANLKLGNVEDAQEEFAQLANGYKHPPSMAYVGFCFSTKKEHSLAIPWYEKAHENGLRSAWVHNNLAVSHDLGKTRQSSDERLALVEQNLKNALEKAPNTPTILYNLVLLDHKKVALDDQYVPRQGIKQLQQLLAIQPDAANAYEVIPALYARVAKSNPTLLDEAMDLLIIACSRNVALDIESLFKKTRFQVFRQHHKYNEFVQATSQIEQSERIEVSKFMKPPTNY